MSDHTLSETEDDDDVLLTKMQHMATRLSERQDAFLKSQYDHLTARISALIELRRCIYLNDRATNQIQG